MNQPHCNLLLIASIEEAGQTHTELLKKFNISKLESKAGEIFPSSPDNIPDVNAIITKLTNSIKPDNSDIICGRLTSLSAERHSKHELSQKIEELTDALKRAFVFEGFSLEKTNELTVKKTVEICKQNTKSTLVKSVLASSKFDSAKDVIAKYVIESADEVQQAQILTFNSPQNQNTHQNFGNNRGNFRNQYNNFRGFSNNRGQSRGYFNNSNN